MIGAIIEPIIRSRLGASIGLMVLGFHLPSANAQVRPDASLSTTVTTTDNLNFLIEGGDRPANGTQNGPNLFHSFDTFSIPDGGSAQFNNATDITNIISRVTGSEPSIIEGLIQTQSEANLFLLNPQGLLFGPNAQLDIGGSFLASTADSMVFQDGSHFSASAPSSPLLTVSVPVGLQMGSNPQPIQQQSQVIQNNESVGLTVDKKETLGLVGGALISLPLGMVNR
ncbi:MAG: filamentous hemagglutinin N-terminal domain-containing protein [Cyanobacteria bacterium P01_F01_bin.150]